MSEIENLTRAHLVVGTRQGLVGIQCNQGEYEAYPYALHGVAVNCLLGGGRGLPLMAGARGGGIWVAADGAKAWRETARLAPAEARALGGDGRTVFAATAPAGLVRSVDSGVSFQAVPALDGPWRSSWQSPDGQSPPSATAIVVDGSRVAIAVHRGGVLVSEDGGNSFRDASADPSRGVLSLIGTAAGGLLAGTTEGLFRGPASAGGDWTLVFRGRERWAVTAVAMYAERPRRLICGAARVVRAAKPGTPSGADSAIHTSEDGGATWSEAKCPQLPVIRGTVSAFVAAPDDPDRLFAGVTSGEILESCDGGASFRIAVSTLPGVLAMVLGNAWK